MLSFAFASRTAMIPEFYSALAFLTHRPPSDQFIANVEFDVSAFLESESLVETHLWSCVNKPNSTDARCRPPPLPTLHSYTQTQTQARRR